MYCKIFMEMKLIKLTMLISLFVFAVFAVAQQGGVYKIEKSVIATGGGFSDGGDIKLQGSIGQGTVSRESTGGNFALTGGFWAQGIRPDSMFKDGFENQ